MYQDQMYFVIDGKAISIDECGSPVICDIDPEGFPDWETEEYIDWLDLLPTKYQIYKDAVDFLQVHTQEVFVK